jgi:hypothetical protein
MDSGVKDRMVQEHERRLPGCSQFMMGRSSNDLVDSAETGRGMSGATQNLAGLQDQGKGTARM